ncbi:NAD-dependent epimerase/dehydratase family protein [Flavobacterium limi]|uniref:Epimerase n=1 Tax=Flavobacterium limi TaxID=2045105 RepID=A0ABQ1U851_9FLAO|nr:NAD-dependent epimerase/dehydratase family protein [Flavobacterium limi]GGF12543.1 epimerase [Flavobacterium limi]
MTKKRNILLIGGAGFIGTNLLNAFIDNDAYNMFVLETPFANISKLQHLEKEITIFKGVLADYDLLQSIILDHNINVVIHLVSTLVPGSSYDDYKREFENIIFPTVRLMGLCAEKNIKFIYFSSGGTIYGNNSQGKFLETDLREPISYYGLSKQIIEDSILFEHRRANLRYLIVRPSNPFGPGQSLNGVQGLIAVAIGKIMANEPITIWGDGSSIRDYIYIDDLVRIMYELINKNVENEIINIGSGIGHSINDILLHLRNIAGDKLMVKYETSRSVDVTSVILDISKLESFIEIKNTPLEDGIRMFYNDVKLILKI